MNSPNAVGAVLVAIYAGINPPGFVAAVVAFAFGLAAASFFPAMFLGIFWKRMNKEGAISGMSTGLIVTGLYIIHFKIGFSSTVIGACALLAAIAATVLYFGTRDHADGVRRGKVNAGIAAGLALIGVIGVAGVLPSFAMGDPANWFLGISPEGFGTVGMALSFIVSIAVSLATKAPPQDVQDLVEEIRLPSVKAHVAHAQPAE